MDRQLFNKLRELIDRTLLDEGLKPYLNELAISFKPFQKTVAKDKFFDFVKYCTYPKKTSSFYNYYERFSDALINLRGVLIRKHGLNIKNIEFAFAEKILLGEISENKNYLPNSISHKVISSEHEGVLYGKYVEIKIQAGSEKPELIQYINKNWRSIDHELKQHLLETGVSGKRIRRRTKQERDAIIYTLSKKTRKELGLRRGEYKEMKIVSILEEEYGIKTTFEAVKQAAIRQRKLRKK